MRVGDCQRERARRLGGNLQFADRLRLDLRRRAVEPGRRCRIALAEMFEQLRVLLAQRLDDRRHMARRLHPADADRKGVGRRSTPLYRWRDLIVAAATQAYRSMRL